MRMYDLIRKKRDGGELSQAEIVFMIAGYVDGEIPDYQMAAMLMAIYLNGMTKEETSIMTNQVTHSGDVVDLSAIEGVKVDKHSTGGVGDKTTLIIGPIVASCGVKVAKMSGRGLGHTGGTVDKLESIKGFESTLSKEEFIDIVNRVGIAVIGQSKNLAPADKKLYALRDVTATVESIPLIAVSIMGKKLAAGNDSILLDIKVGSGAFMKKFEDAAELASTMVSIGEQAGKRTAALITDMDIPLGCAIGNSLEIIEAVDTLNGNGPADLTSLCIELSANMLYLAGKGSLDACSEMAKDSLSSKRALTCFIDMVEAQGGDSSLIKDVSTFQKAPYCFSVKSPGTGYITHMNSEKCGTASSLLGAGRLTKDSVIDYLAGIILTKKIGDKVMKGEEIARLYASDSTLFDEAAKVYLDAVTLGKHVEKRPLIFARIDSSGIEMYK